MTDSNLNTLLDAAAMVSAGLFIWSCWVMLETAKIRAANWRASLRESTEEADRMLTHDEHKRITD